MLFQRSILAVAAGFGLLQAGCFAQSNEMGVEAIDSVGFEVLDDPDPTNPTHTGTNGLETWKFHAQKGQLAAAFLQPLYSSGVTPNSVVQALTASNNPDGQKVFKYAAKCMVPAGTSIVANQVSYPGHGLLNMATVWPNWGLGSQGINEAFACMAVHLNPSGMEVPIKLGGFPIQAAPVNPNAPPDGFTFKEALWATVVTGSIITIHVWPLKDLKDQCTAATNAAMATRVCGTPNGSCNLIVHSSTISECLASSIPGVSQKCYIDGTLTNVIQTWLNPGDVPILYGACAPPT